MGETPDLAEQPDVEEAVEAVGEANDEQPDPSDVNEASVELGEDDLSGGESSLFSGVEDSENATGESAESGGESDAGDEEDADPLGDMTGGLDGNAAALEDAINEGAARLAVVGLTEDDFGEDSAMSKESLEEEFSETFASFRLGYFGSQTIDQYVLQPADGDVNPAWGLCGAMLMAAGMAAWMRPDGDEKVAAIRETVEGIIAGGDA